MHNIEEMVKHTFKILQCLQHNIFKSIFNHIFNFMYKIDKLLKQLMKKHF